MKTLFGICNLPFMLAVTTVHIVPHTHDDVGWLKTVDQYFTNSNNTIQHAGVRQILNSVVEQLTLRPDRQFTYVEQAFFQRWYRELDATQRSLVKKLVASGQLTFVNGGWCMHDEAATHYVGMVDQQSLGHRLLFDEFGPNGVPTVGWQLDPFGHSATHAALLSAEAGMDALFFGRIDYQDLDLRHKSNRSEFIWRASPSLGPDTQIFTGLTGEYGGNYGPPSGFNFDWGSRDEPIEDNKELFTYNLPTRVDQAVARAMKQARMTRGDHIMWTMGSDFNYMNADVWYWNLDKLIDAVNADGRITMKYSNPNAYVAAKKAEAASGVVKWPTDSGDFFPYADGPHQFWTGYFTSRPALKRYVRESSSWFNAIRQTQALASLRIPELSGSHQLQKLEEAMGVAQHHDAVSGTSKQHVASDYALRIAMGRTAALPIFTRSIEALLRRSSETNSPVVFAANGNGPWITCDRLNETVCPATQDSETVALVIWNPLGQDREQLVQVPVFSPLAAISNANGSAVAAQVMPVAETLNSYRRNTEEASHVVSFMAKLAPMSGATFTLTQGSVVSKRLRANRQQTAQPPFVPASPSAAPVHSSVGDAVLENEFLALNFSRSTGRLASIYNKAEQTLVSITQHFCYYIGSVGDQGSSDDRGSGQRSGAYIFRPANGSVCHPIGAPVTHTTLVTGPVVSEVRQTFASWLTQVVRLHRGARSAEFEWTVGEIPLDDPAANKTQERCVAWRHTAGCDSKGRRDPKKDKSCDATIVGNMAGFCECFGGRKAHRSSCGHVPFTCRKACQAVQGKEVVSKFSSSIASQGQLLTDSNGREMQLRRRDYRPTWNLTQTEPVAGNYYPVNAAAAIKDDEAQLTVLVDRSQGAGSLTDGELELMVHRRLTQDDSRGVGEPIDETKEVSPYYQADGYFGGHGGEHYGPGLVVRGTHTISIEPPKSAARIWRPLADQIFAKPPLLFTTADAKEFPASAASALSKPLPSNLALMTFASLREGSILLRLAHQFGLGEDRALSSTVNVDLASLFNPNILRIKSIREVSLTNNQNKSTILAKRRQASLWTGGDDLKAHPWRKQKALDFKTSSVVTLGPLEIKTFVLDVSM